MHYVYILEAEEGGGWYIGYSSDLRRRLKEHNSGKGARHTRAQKDWKLIYYEAYRNKRDALGREKFLKSGSGRTYIEKQLRNYLN